MPADWPLNAAKRHVIIYDYVDAEIPVLARMYAEAASGLPDDRL